MHSNTVSLYCEIDPARSDVDRGSTKIWQFLSKISILRNVRLSSSVCKCKARQGGRDSQETPAESDSILFYSLNMSS